MNAFSTNEVELAATNIPSNSENERESFKLTFNGRNASFDCFRKLMELRRGGVARANCLALR